MGFLGLLVVDEIVVVVVPEVVESVSIVSDAVAVVTGVSLSTLVGIGVVIFVVSVCSVSFGLVLLAARFLKPTFETSKAVFNAP